MKSCKGNGVNDLRERGPGRNGGKVKNRTLKTEGYGTPNRLGSSDCRVALLLIVDRL
jgi:hypothetical protein